MFEPEETDPSEYLAAINAGETFDLVGKSQCWIAAKALAHTGIAPDIQNDIIGALKVHAFHFEDCEENEVGLRYIVVGDQDYRETVKGDIIFSLRILSMDPNISEEEFIASDALASILEAK